MLIRILSRAGLGALLAALAVSSVAFAKAGDRSFTQTYPVASSLCAKASANTLPKGLQANSAQVVAACTRLQSGFGPLQSTVQAAQRSFAGGVQSTRASVRAACAMGQPRPACRQARRQGRATLAGLRAQHKVAVRTYFLNIEANRRSFWATIRSLRGGQKIKADARIAPRTN